MAQTIYPYKQQVNILVYLRGQTITFPCYDRAEALRAIDAIHKANAHNLQMAIFDYANGTATGAITLRNVLAIQVLYPIGSNDGI